MPDISVDEQTSLSFEKRPADHTAGSLCPAGQFPIDSEHPLFPQFPNNCNIETDSRQGGPLRGDDGWSVKLQDESHSVFECPSRILCIVPLIIRILRSG